MRSEMFETKPRDSREMHSENADSLRVLYW